MFQSRFSTSIPGTTTSAEPEPTIFSLKGCVFATSERAGRIDCINGNVECVPIQPTTGSDRLLDEAGLNFSVSTTVGIISVRAPLLETYSATVWLPQITTRDHRIKSSVLRKNLSAFANPP